MDALRDGSPRTRPRKPGTIRRYLRCIHPALLDWSARYGHLREITTSDITTATGALRGHQRHQVLVALRSLTRHCRKTGLIFADPAARIHAAHRPDTMIIPLGPGQIGEATAAASTPAARLALALAAAHVAKASAEDINWLYPGATVSELAWHWHCHRHGQTLYVGPVV